MVCMFVERVKEYCFTFFFSTLSVSTWECLSLDVVSLSVEHCCFLLVVDCMYLCTFKKNVSVFLYKLFLGLGTFEIVQRHELIYRGTVLYIVQCHELIYRGTALYIVQRLSLIHI